MPAREVVFQQRKVQPFLFMAKIFQLFPNREEEPVKGTRTPRQDPSTRTQSSDQQ